MKFTFPNIQTHPRDPLLLTYPLFVTYPIHHSLYSYFSHTQSIILSILIFHFLFLVSLLPLFRGKVVASDFRCVSRFCSRLVLIFLFLLFPSSAGTFHGFFLKKKKTNSRSVSAQIGPYWAESETKKKKKSAMDTRAVVSVRDSGAPAQMAHLCFLINTLKHALY